MKLSFSTLGCPEWSIEQIIERARQYGFDGVELRTTADGNHFRQDASLGLARDVGKKFLDAGLIVSSVMGYSMFASMEAAPQRANAALLGKLVDIAEAMGAPFVRTFGGQLPKGADKAAMAGRVIEAIKPLARQAADKGVRIGVETHDDWCGGDDVMRLVHGVDSPGFGVVYDIYNGLFDRVEPWETTYAKVREHICYCHIKDGYRRPDGEHQYVYVGAGELPLQELLRRLKTDGFGSFLSLEWEKKWHPELDPPERVFPQYVYKMRQVMASL